MIKCPACVDGLIDRSKEELEEHMPWARHLFTKEICTKCGGSGKVKLDPKSITSEWPSPEQAAVLEMREELG